MKLAKRGGLRAGDGLARDEKTEARRRRGAKGVRRSRAGPPKYSLQRGSLADFVISEVQLARLNECLL